MATFKDVRFVEDDVDTVKMLVEDWVEMYGYTPIWASRILCAVNGDYEGMPSDG